jgi:hypothetical protein
LSETKSNDRKADGWISIARWSVLSGLFLVVFFDLLRTMRVSFPHFYVLLWIAVMYRIVPALLIHFQFSHPRLPLVTIIIDSLLSQKAGQSPSTAK